MEIFYAVWHNAGSGNGEVRTYTTGAPQVGDYRGPMGRAVLVTTDAELAHDALDRLNVRAWSKVAE